MTTFAALGAHVPIGQRIRLDLLEFGAARVPLLDDFNIVPFVSAGASYAFSFDVSEAFAAGARQGTQSVAEGSVDSKRSVVARPHGLR